MPRSAVLIIDLIAILRLDIRTSHRERLRLDQHGDERSHEAPRAVAWS